MNDTKPGDTAPAANTVPANMVPAVSTVPAAAAVVNTLPPVPRS